MTEIGVNSNIAADTTAGRPDVAVKALYQQVLASVFRQGSARTGIFWIVSLVALAVFAPFLANTHPLLMKRGGVVSSPLLRHLTPSDVILVVAFFTAVVLWFFKRVRLTVKAIIFVVVLVVASVTAGMTVRPPEVVVYEQYRNWTQAGEIEWAWYVPVRYSPDDHQRDVEDARLKAPTGMHWFGTTADAADLLSNMLYATRIALSIGFISTGIAVVIGVFIGGLMGYYSGIIDLLGMRLVEIFDAIPTLLLILSFVAFFRPNDPAILLYSVMAIIGLTSWVQYAYFVRAEFLKLREQDFVHAARAAGLPLRSILFKHMLPNGITPVLITASFGVAGAILIESTLSFLGIGLPGESSWGGLLNQALGVGGSFYWWIAIYPGLAIFLTVYAYNLVGEAFRDALDPKLYSFR
ncbi:MAG TPA: ABC transporter permease [Tepidisphaeraceae bacterium]|jgi:peptide/nickel transport system permease protein|nr:ABC transporter permease [Tepidisphaeraceae bacterium]